jgi:RNAse (barnase) inhibitor barstar
MDRSNPLGKQYMTEQLRGLTPPWFHTFIGSPSDLTNYSWSVAASGARDLAVRTLRGAKMRTTLELFDEFAAAFQFPDYFGENWDALKECLEDLSWLPAAGYVIVIRDSTTVMSNDDTVAFGSFVRLLDNVASAWSVAIARGEVWDRPAKPFHVVMHTLAGDVAKLSKIMDDSGKSLSEINR